MTEPDLLQEEPPGYGAAGKADPLLEYLRKIERALERGDATEETHYSALQILLEALDERVIATIVPKRVKCGAPDFVISRKREHLTLGHIEAKDVGADLSEIERSEQLRRYLASLPNLLLTDYVEFRWFVEGKKRETFRLAAVQPRGKLAPVSPEEIERGKRLLLAFLAQRPVDIGSAEELARRLAKLTHLIRDLICGAFATGQASQQLRDWRGAFAATLLPELAPQGDRQQEAEAVAEFADMFAQTLAYGLFSACASSGPTGFTREKAQQLIPRTNPFLRAFFEQITGTALDEEPFAGFVEDLIQTLAHADMARILEDFGKRGHRRDPVVHFYETFLQAYDPKVRELRGVYYTPEPVVNYIVQSIDRLLKDKFDIRAGLADRSKVTVRRREGEREITDETHRVLILDPAAGTGTFLYTVLDFIRWQFKARKSAGQWGSYVHEHLLPRLFGFELLMAPYAVAHFKLGLALAAMDEEPLFRQQWSYEPQASERVNVFLTNTLEHLEHTADLIGPLRALSNEANCAYEVKEQKPVLVVLGNPPYSGHSANKGEWISNLVRDYYLCDGQPLGERNPKWLQDDYVKFIRWGQWRIEQTGQGVLALITNHGYLDNPTFRGMRQNLMQSFDEIYVLDLHGNSKKKERVPGSGEADKNVFDIQQGVAIGIFVKLPPEAKGRAGSPLPAARGRQDERRARSDAPYQKTPATVHHCDLWGAQRKTKYAWLDGHHVENTRWTKLEPTAPHYLFIPQDTKQLREYERGWKLTQMMPIHSLGITAGRDHFTVSFSRRELRRRIQTFLVLDSEEARRRFDLGPDSRDWQVKLAQADLKRGSWDSGITRILYRPFDLRETCYTGVSRGFHCMARQAVMRHFLSGDQNLGLSTTRSVEIRQRWTHVFATHEIAQLHTVSLKEVNYLFPLYLYPDGKLPEKDLFAHKDARRPNLSAGFIREFCAKLQVKFVPDGLGRPGRREVGPELVFNYAYAVFHSPAYRQRYAEFLRADFPRLPITSDYELFRALAGFGGELVDLHARGKGEPRNISFPVKGDNVIEEVRYQPPGCPLTPSLSPSGGEGIAKIQSLSPDGGEGVRRTGEGHSGRVWINDRQYFEGVPEAAWTFPIGGYLPAQRWLKDRIGRALDYDEQAEYQRIIWALSETKRLMGEIDSTIEQHGGWPLE
jgi:hypothetical protein